MTPDSDPPADGGGEAREGSSDAAWNRLPSSRYATISHAKWRHRRRHDSDVVTDGRQLLSHSSDDAALVQGRPVRVFSRSVSVREGRATAVLFDAPLRRASSLPRNLSPLENSFFMGLRDETVQKTSTMPLKRRIEYRWVGGVTAGWVGSPVSAVCPTTYAMFVARRKT